MALHGSILMNTDRVASWAAVRGAPTGQGDEHTYAVEVVLREMDGKVEKFQTVVVHRYSDGALSLTAKALSALDLVRNGNAL